MGVPYIWLDGFENGNTVATATSGSLIDFPHYTELARARMTPYRGAYSMRVRLAGGTTSQFIREDTAFDDWITTPVTRFVRWYFYLGKDFVMADGDKLSMFEAESTLNTTTQVAAGIMRNSGNLEFVWNQNQAAFTAGAGIVLGTTTTALGQWFCAEIKGVLAGGGAGTIDGYINDGIGTQVTTLTQLAIVDAKFGAIGPDAGTSGTILMDDCVYDNVQVAADRFRYRTINARTVAATDHPLIGRGRFSVAVTGTSTDAVATLYDTDGAPSNLEPFAVLSQVSAKEMIPGHDIFEVERGVYCVLSGAAANSPQAFFSIDKGGVVSDGQMITLGLANGVPRT